MAKNESLINASAAKQDEFYTTYDSIQKELNYYEDKFIGKTIFCNCDDPFESNFCKFFMRNFNYLKLKRLICTSYSGSSILGTQLSLFDDYNKPLNNIHGYVLDINEIPMNNGRGISDDDINWILHQQKIVKRLKGDGDFRSEECIKYLKQSDIVITNEPFSLFREYIKQIFDYNKQFLIIGNTNNITYKETFPLLKNNLMWLGVNHGDMKFTVPNNYPPRKSRFWIDENGQKWRSFGNICWFTNLDYAQRHEDLILYKSYSEKEYKEYDNFKAIEVSKVADIPMDYSGIMGVPITFLDKYNPDQFEIIGLDRYTVPSDQLVGGRLSVDGKTKYARILIKNKRVKKNEN
ncbi:adenine-specific methyltransferase EcoRI family protein [Apilactobacillus sp. M161]|uniref:Adenine-specific methyltransferase EcoRI family protein n=1 Tax=Apilactobacillus xinyiensis TaxID=2841032 RepID=A0ABT0I3D0_9LACO|nr:adenine-specific methyltransferase EcoRI family protein [Apilactobacillus xinyiensis]MCK8625213.1 adenine-specific methyltransferase EcoRI family protein [Apilactobacillus xinyiensis]